MADSAPTPNTITAEGANRSTRAGDIPDSLMRRYYLDGRGGSGLGFYADARIKTPAFRDHGRALVAVRTDPKAIRDMTAVALHRGWSTVVVRGVVDFRREAWLSAKSEGLDVRGYKPTDRDLQDLERRQVRRARRPDDGKSPDVEPSRGRSARDLSPEARASLRVIETVVRSRVATPAAQEKILTAARQRISNWLERGARLQPLTVQQRDIADHRASRSRSKGR